MTQTASDPSGDSLCPNPACGAANRTGTRFCAACGTALAGAPPVSVAPPETPRSETPRPESPRPESPPQPPRYQPAAIGYAPVAADKSVDVAMAAEWAYNHATQALQAMGADIAVQNPPSALTAVILKKTIGNPLRFRCQVTIQPTGPATSRITYGVKVDWHSTILILGVLAGVGAFNLMFLTVAVGYWVPLLSAAALGWAVYDYAIAIPNKLADELYKRLVAGPQVAPVPAPGAPSNVTPLPHVGAPPVASSHAAPPPVVAAPVAPAPAADDDIIVRLEKLAMLKDKGLISAAEFDSRRAELLDRL